MEQRTSYNMVKEFHEKFYHPVKEGAPDLRGMDAKRMRMRMDLIAEEFFELVGAVYSDEARKHMEEQWLNMYDDMLHVNEFGEHNADVVEAADALGDMEYVINGFALEAAIPLPDVMAEIHESNMSKLGADGKPIYREDNKILKGPNYFKPNIAKAMGLPSQDDPAV